METPLSEEEILDFVKKSSIFYDGLNASLKPIQEIVKTLRSLEMTEENLARLEAQTENMVRIKRALDILSKNMGSYFVLFENREDDGTIKYVRTSLSIMSDFNGLI